MTKGHEIGNVIVIQNPSNGAERDVNASCIGVANWFDREWNRAAPYPSIRADYLTAFEDWARRPSPPVTDDDSADVDFAPRRRALTPEQLRQLRTCQTFWIDAGLLSRNRGPTRPGDQLMMKRLMRVYFGIPAVDVPENTALGIVTIEYGGVPRADCTLRFSDNSMDVLTLPVPGAGGPPTYDNQTLRFDRRAGTDVHFDLTVATGATAGAWKRKSQRAGTAYRLSSGGREWGVF
jgi:hypothetical protein